jgi:signal transduction histidine kinase
VLLARRRYPIAVLAAVTLLVTVVTFSVDANNDLLAIPIALYAVAAFRSAALAAPLAVAALAVGTGGLVLHSSELGSRLGPIDFTGLGLLMVTFCVVAILLGALAASRRRRMAVLVEQAEQLSRDRDNQATIAALAERARIAREMHDIVAHSLSVMVALADGAAAAVERSPESARRALDELGETGRTALADMRRLLGVLGDGPSDPLRPAPSRRDIPELVARFRTAGLPVRLSETGEPATDLALELTLYRLTQEALTNALRYAVDPSLVTVDVRYTADQVALTVTDDGHGSGDRAAPSIGTAKGVAGMQERAAVHGGSVVAGRLPDGGWRVEAVLPRSVAPAGAGSHA